MPLVVTIGEVIILAVLTCFLVYRRCQTNALIREVERQHEEGEYNGRYIGSMELDEIVYRQLVVPAWTIMGICCAMTAMNLFVRYCL